MENVNGGGRVPITVGSKMYSTVGGKTVPVVGVRRSPESGVVVPTPQDERVLAGSGWSLKNTAVAPF